MMPSLPQLLILAGVAVILFKSKEIPRLLSDVGAGIRDFRKNLKEEEALIDAKTDV